MRQHVTHTVIALFAGSSGHVPHTLDLSYDPADPFTVRIRIEGVVWDIDRETVARGLTGPAGDGAIRVAPYAHVCRRPGLSGGIAVDFLKPGEFGRLVLNRTDLCEFLSATYEAVRAGTESAHLDIDATIARLRDAA
ncbi:SsgA family sporulation/cell division regulator [Nocardiopsis sp. NPDC049922]|uniref:SsgA family sporulation/cell division regulator n=1 Tax=Nocardiopsis sp. NPDC049922 TaxID=3155157 RepID=UPI0033E5812F